ncbi:MAG TPA: hypothetical protein H9903_12675 [Candidatus Aquabacterium excrementipullorum]|nr:hypothetical protein [Candidatus Aquabacterium excrementipullorum]
MALPSVIPQFHDKAQTADLALGAAGASAHLKARVTPSGLLATGGLVCGILLSVTALVWAATSVRRRHPVTSALRRR